MPSRHPLPSEPTPSEWQEAAEALLLLHTSVNGGVAAPIPRDVQHEAVPYTEMERDAALALMMLANSRNKVFAHPQPISTSVAISNGHSEPREMETVAEEVKGPTASSQTVVMDIDESSDDEVHEVILDEREPDNVEKKPVENRQRYEEEASSDEETSSKLNVRTVNGKKEPMITLLGRGHAKVPARVWKTIDWRNSSSAIRKLLTSVFSREVLATHSLSGRPSPAFPNKPAKQRLDPLLIADIIQTAMIKCKITMREVRSCITTKCADETKMWRSRQRRNSHKENSLMATPRPSRSSS